MKILLRSNPVVLTCLALTAGSSHAEGFLDDSKASLNLRNFYLNRNFVNGNYPQAKAEEWTQSFILDARSGYTEGLVDFGVDVLGLYSVKLDSLALSATPSRPKSSAGRPVPRQQPAQRCEHGGHVHGRPPGCHLRPLQLRRC